MRHIISAPGMVEQDRCEICRFVRKRYLHQSVAWECHLNGPRGEKMEGWPSRDTAVWPTVESRDWCGQFQRANEPAQER